MFKKLRWISQIYRGMYVHAVAFEVAKFGREPQFPVPKWGSCRRSRNARI